MEKFRRLIRTYPLTIKRHRENSVSFQKIFQNYTKILKSVQGPIRSQKILDSTRKLLNDPEGSSRSSQISEASRRWQKVPKGSTTSAKDCQGLRAGKGDVGLLEGGVEPALAHVRAGREPVGLVRPVADGAGDLDGAEHAAVPHVAPALLNPLPLLVHAGAVLPRQLHRLPVSALLPRDHRLVGHKCEPSFLLFWYVKS